MMHYRRMPLLLLSGGENMAFCEFCKMEGQKGGACAYCGTAYYTAGVTFIYGQTEKESYGSEFRLTDKYLIVRSVSNGEMLGNVTAGAAFGVLGALAAGAVDAARKKSYGFYDLQDLQKVIYPYHTNTLKKDTAFKFVNKDGSDFILNFNLNGMFSGKAAKNFADALIKVGVFVENGAGNKFSVCCMKPFVNKDTFGTRVCQSAATFVKMTEKQFIAQPINTAPQTSQQPTYAQPVAQPVYQAPPVQQTPEQPVTPQPVVQQPVHQAPTVQQVPAQPIQQPTVQEPAPVATNATPAVNASAWQSAWQTPAAAPVEEKKPEQVMCHTCGSMNSSTAKFCSKCGTPFSNQQQSSISIDDWKNKW